MEALQLGRNLESLLFGGLQMVSSSKCSPLGGGGQREKGNLESYYLRDVITFLIKEDRLFQWPRPQACEGGARFAYLEDEDN